MRYEVNIAELADHFVIVLKDKQTRQVKRVFTLNHLGADILRAYMEDKPQDELAPELAERYGTSLESMQQQVSQTMTRLAHILANATES